MYKDYAYDFNTSKLNRSTMLTDEYNFEWFVDFKERICHFFKILPEGFGLKKKSLHEI